MKKKVLVLGCTGSIGTSTLNIIREFSNQFVVCGLTAHSNQDALEELSKEFDCNAIALTSKDPNALRQIIKNSHADIAVNGISGAAGLMPSVLCLENGIDLALANKETIVMAGPLIKKLAKKNNCTIIPVDSEHSAIFSLIEHYGRDNLDKIILTASGGPFRTLERNKLALVEVEDALKHPTWDMGQKITIDSASLANKGLEVIEACRLFNLAPEQVCVTIHPQSLVHSFICTKDGDLYAQISKPDMRRPILSALSWPNTLKNSMKKLDFTSEFTMSFSPPRNDDFPLLPLAFMAQKKGGAYTIAYNAANEVAVDLFLQRKITFNGIAKLVALVLEVDWTTEPVTFDEVFLFNKEARTHALNIYENSNYAAFRKN